MPKAGGFHCQRKKEEKLDVYNFINLRKNRN